MEPLFSALFPRSPHTRRLSEKVSDRHGQMSDRDGHVSDRAGEGPGQSAEIEIFFRARLVKDREVGLVYIVRKLLDLGASARLLVTELVAGESEHLPGTLQDLAECRTSMALKLQPRIS